MSQITFTKVELEEKKIERNVKYDNYFKVIMLGKSGVGKTCILNMYCDGKFIETQKPTIGGEIFNTGLKTSDGKRIKLIINDLSGQDRFDSVTKNFYRDAKGAIIVCDIMDSTSVYDSVKWYNKTREFAGDIPVIFAVNKLDLIINNENNIQHINSINGMVESFGCDCVYTSAKKNTRLNEVFFRLTAKMMTDYYKERFDPVYPNEELNKTSINIISVTKEIDEKKSSCC